jgi:hypothetical protein
MITNTTKVAGAIIALVAISVSLAPLGTAGAANRVFACPGDAIDDTCVDPGAPAPGGGGIRPRVRVAETDPLDRAMPCPYVIYVACAE